MGEPANPTTTTEMPAGIQAVIAEESVFANAQYLVWDNFAMHREVTPGGSGATFPVLSALAAATSALSVSANPAPAQLGEASVTLTTSEYGNPVEIQKKLLRTSQEQILRDAIKILAVNMAESRDSLAGAAFVGGSNVRFVNGRVDAAALASGDIISRAEIVRAWTALTAALAPPFDDGTYYAAIHPYGIGDLFVSGGTLGDFVDVAKYANPESIRTGEIGKFMGFTVFKASQRTYDNLSAGVANVADRLLSVFAGSGFGGLAIGDEPMVIPSFDSMDRLQRFVNLGWKGDFKYGRIREENAIRIESRSNVAPAP